VIEVRRLVKTFGIKPVLRGLDFYVEPGEFVALLGPNGAGKTTFLRILASLSRPTLGEVRLAGYALPAQAAAFAGPGGKDKDRVYVVGPDGSVSVLVLK